MPMTYSTLIGAKTNANSILGWVNYSKLPVETVLEEAQALVYSLIRTREMRAVVELTLPEGDHSIALPERFLEPLLLKDTTGIKFDFVTPDRIEEDRVFDSDGNLEEGMPSKYSVFDEALQFDMATDTELKLRLLMYQSPPLLSADNESNWLTSRYPQLLRSACQAIAADFMKDTAEYRKCLERTEGLATTANREADLLYASASLDLRIT